MAVSEHTSLQPAGRTLRRWIFQKLVPGLYLSASHKRPHLARSVKYPLAGTAEQYRGVLHLPLSGMFTVQVRRPKTIKGGAKTEADE